MNADDTNFAKRMKMRREGLKLCDVCEALTKPEDLDERGWCPACVQREVERLAKEAAEKERQEHIALVARVRAAPLEELDVPEMLLRGVKDGVWTQPQADDIVQKIAAGSREYSETWVRNTLRDTYAQREEQKRLEQQHEDEVINQRIVRSNSKRAGQTKKLLSDALQRLMSGRAKTVTIIVANRAAMEQYETYVNLKVPFATKTGDGQWAIGGGTLRVQKMGRAGVPGHSDGNTLVDPECEGSGAGGSSYGGHPLGPRRR